MGFKCSILYLLQFLGQDNWMFSFSTEDYRLWNLVTSYHGFYFLSFLQTNSLLQALTQAGLAPDCVEETLYLANIFVIDTCKLLAYKWHLSTQPPSDREGRYNSKWLHFFVTPCNQTDMYSPQKMLKNIELFLLGSFRDMNAFIL